jgi:DoxX-like family
MNMKKTQIAGWILSFLIAAFLIFASALGKFTEWEGKAAMFEQIGYSTDTMVKIGIVEVSLAILFLIPRTAFLGAVLLTGYLGGATATHVRVGEAFFMPIIVGIVVWIALGLRRPEVFALALRAPKA